MKKNKKGGIRHRGEQEGSRREDRGRLPVKQYSDMEERGRIQKLDHRSRAIRREGRVGENSGVSREKKRTRKCGRNEMQLVERNKRSAPED